MRPLHQKPVLAAPPQPEGVARARACGRGRRRRRSAGPGGRPGRVGAEDGVDLPQVALLGRRAAEPEPPPVHGVARAVEAEAEAAPVGGGGGARLGGGGGGGGRCGLDLPEGLRGGGVVVGEEGSVGRGLVAPPGAAGVRGEDVELLPLLLGGAVLVKGGGEGEEDGEAAWFAREWVR